MAPKSKDLFVILAERQKAGHDKQAARARSGGRSPHPRSKTESTSGVGEFGEKIGRWVQGAVRSLRGEAEASGKSKSKRPAATGRVPGSRLRSSSPVNRVPRGLLLPGWMLAAMLVTTLGLGFAVGNLTSSGPSDSNLAVNRGSAAPGSFTAGTTPRMNDTLIEERLGSTFYVVAVYGNSDEARAKAVRLALYIQSQGLASARIYAHHGKNGALRSWATVCYAPESDLESLEIRKRVERMPAPVGFAPEVLGSNGNIRLASLEMKRVPS